MKVERLQKMAGSVRTGGKGTVRRKKKAVHKALASDDKRLQTTFKRLGLNPIPGIEEVLMLSADGSALRFANPKLQTSSGSNTYVVTGPSQSFRAQDMIAAMSGVGTQGMVLDDSLVYAPALGLAAVAYFFINLPADVAQMMGGMGAVTGGFPGGMASMPGMMRGVAGPMGSGAGAQFGKLEEDEDDDVPDLEENFEGRAGL